MIGCAENQQDASFVNAYPPNNSSIDADEVITVLFDDTMSTNLQIPFNFDEKETSNSQFIPKGYKGFANFHKYWGKKPGEVWRFLINKLSRPHDIVLDPFMGSGLIGRECVDNNCRFIGFDVNPICIELTNLYLHPPDYIDLAKSIYGMEKIIKSEINSMYELSNGVIATHFLWNNDQITRVWTKNGRKRVELTPTKLEIEKLQNTEEYQPVRIRELQLFDNSRINSKKAFSVKTLFTPRALRAIDIIKGEIEKHSGDLKRALLLILSASAGQMSKMVFAVSNRGKTKGIETDNVEVGSWVVGYWCPAQHFEINAWNCYTTKANKLLKAVEKGRQLKSVTISTSLDDFLNKEETVYIQQGDSEQLLKNIPSASINVILTDPPHGDRIPYLELSEMWNSIIGLDSNYEEELVVSNAKERGKDVKSYNEKLSAIFYQCARVLKKNGIMAILFNTRSECHWQSFRELEDVTGLTYIGCYPSAYSAGSVLQDNRKGGLKSDFVLLYGNKINEEKRFETVDTFNDVKDWTTLYPLESD